MFSPDFVRVYWIGKKVEKNIEVRPKIQRFFLPRKSADERRFG